MEAKQTKQMANANATENGKWKMENKR